MKKLLRLLFLLFVLNVPMLTVGSGEKTFKNNKRIYDFLEYNKELSNIKIRLEDKSTTAYLDLDSIPIYCPIKTTSIDGMSSDYGYRIHPIYGYLHKHVGIDIKSRLDTEVLSTANGVVELVNKSRYGYGNQVVIKHANGYKTRYAHLNKIMVKQGDSVNVKTIIGTLGDTGLTTGPHLHYEIIKNNKTIDPLIFTYKDRKQRNFASYLKSMIALEKY